jgi:glycosyltransferase involved in cell wall biosynthesis
VVSHPIQYLAPLYRRLAARADVEIKVFFTWHAGASPIEDRGFRQFVAWDIPLTEGYEFELIPNVAAEPGTHRFLGLRNPELVERVTSWQPDIVHITGWAWLSHLHLLRVLHRRGIPSVFFGDSHLLDGNTAGPRWWLKTAVLRRIYSWPSGILVPGSANRAYCEHFCVPPKKLHHCPHSIDVGRFAARHADFETETVRWRSELQIGPDRKVLLYAGKFEPKKRPVELMRAVSRLRDPTVMLILVGGGALQDEIDALAAVEPFRFRVLPFQNQSRMPIVYRLGDLFVLPSAYGETWGLAVNEALACATPVIVSDRVGCAADVVEPSCGRIFAWNDWVAFERAAMDLLENRSGLEDMRRAATMRARLFDVAVTERALLDAVSKLCGS